jgi:hypothetical protein
MNIADTNTAAEKCSRLYKPIHYLYLEFITWAEESRLRVQSLNAASFISLLVYCYFISVNLVEEFGIGINLVF